MPPDQVPNIRTKTESNSYTRRTAELLAQAEKITTVEKYRYVHKNYTEYVFEASGIAFKKERERLVGESKLFDREDDAYNAAVRDSLRFDKGQNSSRGDNFIETKDILVYNQYDPQKEIYFTILDVNRWEIQKVQVGLS